MSDRLPFRRRSGGGKHVATRAPRSSVPVAVQAVVAATLAGALGLVAVNPALGGAGSAVQAARPAPAVSLPSAVAPFSSASAAEERSRREARDTTRTDLAQIADAAVTQAQQVLAKAQSAQLPADQVAALGALEQQVDDLVGQLAPQRLERVSRAAVRAGGEAVAPDEGAAATDEAGAADPAGTVDPATGVAGPATGAATPDATAPQAEAPDDATGAPPADAAAPADPGTVAAPAAPTDPAAPAAPTDPAAPAAPTVDITDAEALTAVLPSVAAADDPTASALRDTLLALAQAATAVDDAADQAAAAAAAAAADAQARAQWADSLDGYPNGRIPSSALCAPAFAPGALLRCDAAEALDRLDAAYAAVFGADLQVTDSYRSYGAQVACRRAKGSLCATPGTSNHGWGVAVDLGGAAHTDGTDAHDWLLANARTYGWDLPQWARSDGSKPEPWHWEYVA